jgi:hypothetical protein
MRMFAYRSSNEDVRIEKQQWGCSHTEAAMRMFAYRSIILTAEALTYGQICEVDEVAEMGGQPGVGQLAAFV